MIRADTHVGIILVFRRVCEQIRNFKLFRSFFYLCLILGPLLQTSTSNTFVLCLMFVYLSVPITNPELPLCSPRGHNTGSKSWNSDNFMFVLIPHPNVFSVVHSKTNSIGLPILLEGTAYFLSMMQRSLSCDLLGSRMYIKLACFLLVLSRIRKRHRSKSYFTPPAHSYGWTRKIEP